MNDSFNRFGLHFMSTSLRGLIHTSIFPSYALEVLAVQKVYCVQGRKIHFSKARYASCRVPCSFQGSKVVFCTQTRLSLCEIVRIPVFLAVDYPSILTVAILELIHHTFCAAELSAAKTHPVFPIATSTSLILG